ncbi:uncharacterized protein SPAPADRAFT_67273 [Spathaspora passalidarum NRRL Y-27907]|uniref:Exocyst complex component Sec6 n=1 Tax=Spathaspora passalidarum (strain NRRL Y-27907 / 11-Y1) TaxID=619300 RepID=G3AQV9_SPAPN|nr:uncharacterized protein SPAPADRAFT_67273 [Spathaspora passalidarum NRRL Y-27907]EGW31186.1 hypothetical protein SPAPADRAFT_67273 [Spathaspora passalidarum NRRL Y-27907]
MSDSALSKIGELIKMEDDLVKISSLRQQFLKEKSSLDINLSATTQRQIDAIMDNLSKLNNTSKRLQSIKGNMNKINQIYDESITDIKDYDTIRKMTIVNSFLTQVSNLKGDIFDFKAFLDILNQNISDEYDQLRQSLTYPLPNIFQIHYAYTQARNFTDYMETYSKSLSDDSRSLVLKIVSPMKHTRVLFDELLKEAIISLIEMAKDENYECIFNVVKVIEIEAREDMKVAMMESLKLSHDNSMINYSNFRSSRRNYKKFFYDKLEESLDETFNNCIEYYPEKMQVYDNLGWLEEELIFVKKSLIMFFPPTWKIDEFIQNVYFNRLHKFTMEVIESEPTAEDLMKILSYDKRYGKFIESLQEGKRTPKDQRSIIGEDLKNVVLEDYLKVIVSKMGEWNRNLMKQETESFRQRSEQPTTYNYFQSYLDDEQGMAVERQFEADVFVLPDFTTPLTMLQQQADVAAESGYSNILVGVIENWSKCYLERIENFRNILEDEIDRYMSIYNKEKYLIKESAVKRLFKRKPSQAIIDPDALTDEEINEISRPGLIEYLTALGNTFVINTDRLQDKFLPKYKDNVHAHYQDRIQQAIESTLTPSTDLNAQIITAIVEIIINDLYPALSTLFTKKWYEEDQQTSNDPISAQLIVQTIKEYMQDLRSYASYDMYSLTFNVLLDKFISSYIRIGLENILHGDGKKIDPTAVKKYKSFSEAVDRDIAVFFGGLSDLFTAKDGYYLMTSLRALEFVADIGMCPDPMNDIPHIWEKNILPTFYFCKVDVVRATCLCRKDMDKVQINQLIPELEAIQRGYHANVEPPEVIVTALANIEFN